MTVKVSQGHGRWCYLLGHNYFLLVVCSTAISVWHCFQDIIILTVYVTIVTAWTYSNEILHFDMAVKIVVHLHFPIHV